MRVTNNTASPITYIVTDFEGFTREKKLETNDYFDREFVQCGNFMLTQVADLLYVMKVVDFNKLTKT